MPKKYFHPTPQQLKWPRFRSRSACLAAARGEGGVGRGGYAERAEERELNHQHVLCFVITTLAVYHGVQCRYF